MPEKQGANPIPVQFRAGPLEPHLTARVSHGLGRPDVCHRDLGRYYDALAVALASVELTEAEALGICDCLNGTLLEPMSIRLMWAEVADACRLDGLDRKWGFTAQALVEELRALPPFTLFSIADAVERFWRDPTTEAGAKVREVGLVR